ncbi:PDDEXK nuclease domain-containing protein [Flavobacterium sp. NG2]|uniref:PDDEXK nuclease domain-containing protein n=1 Tax=Flavobacterium sp. NG2 TaxID=3097547 RepID=UPI002A832626|nr:PDDEXK nuclease domain-containing protein [Flavobacterium sp. NG2]WPR71983.1 PDDEXK nuclease domain-containing protein [Flavobacterium sp. NG2]
MSKDINKALFTNLAQIIEQGKQQLVSQVNSTLTITYWHIGNEINKHILNYERAEYGKQIVIPVATQLVEKYGRSFEIKNLYRMMQFADIFPEIEIVAPLARQLSWSHFTILIPLKTKEARMYYAQKSIEQRWSKRELRNQIDRKGYERNEIAALQSNTNFSIPKDTFKDPYFLDFLGLKDGYLENDLEAAIIKELELFILEMGKGFAFVERQKRIILDGKDFYLDLLFYHRTLKRLVAIELKLGEFKPSHKGQMELYLKWLNKYEKQEGENTPIGLILCAGKSNEQIELLEMHKDGIMVAEYWTALPPKKQLEEKLHSILIEAKARIENLKSITE